MKKMIFIVICLALSGCAGKRLPLVKVSVYTSNNASATSNVFVLKEVTSEFSVGDIVTFGDSKKEHEIVKVNALKKSESGNIEDGYIYMEKEWAIRVLYKGTEFKITQRPFSLILSGDGNIQGIVLKKAVGFKISPGMRVSAVR